MNNTLIVDANAIGYAAHAGPKLRSGELETQAIFGFIKTIRSLTWTYPSYAPLILWDGKADWRYDLLPEYKSNRTLDPARVAIKESYVKQRPHISRMLSALGVRQFTAMKHEADDMAGYFVRQLMTTKPEGRIQLITGDVDWAQLIRPGVEWRDIRNGMERDINMSNLMDETGFATPYALLEGKCLQGDTSDCIPGVGGIGEKTAPEFLAEFGSVREFWRRVDSGEFVPRLKKHINLSSAAGRMTFGRNFRLMQLMKVAPPAREDVVLVAGKFDRDLFLDLCAEFGFASILRDPDTFLKNFKDKT